MIKITGITGIYQLEIQFQTIDGITLDQLTISEEYLVLILTIIKGNNYYNDNINTNNNYNNTTTNNNNINKSNNNNDNNNNNNYNYNNNNNNV